MKIKPIKVVTFVLALFMLSSCASTITTAESTKVTTIALDLSSTYLKNREVDDALRVLNTALEMSEDIRLVENRVLIYKNEEMYREMYNESLRLYNKFPHYTKAIRYAIEAAEALEDNKKLSEAYALLFEKNAVTISDINGLLKETIENNDKTNGVKLINYALEKNMYDKEFFENAYTVTGDKEYQSILEYLK